MRYVRSLDGIRAICVLLVVCQHTSGKPWWINGSVGVDIFFALSGFLITTLLVREYERDGTVSLKGFYVRRVCRIVPLYFLTIALYFPSVWITAIALHDMSGVEHFRGAFPWLITFNSELRPAAAGNLFGHAWTLGIEEKFYVLWPLAILPVLALGRRSLVLLPLLLIFLPWPLMFRGYVGITCGVVMSLLIERGGARALIARIPTAFWVAALAAAYIITFATPDERVNILIAVAAALLVASLVHNPGSLTDRILSTRPLPFLGVLTYAIYLTHRLVGNAVEAAFAIGHVQETFWVGALLVYGLTIPVAYLLHIVIEKPAIAYGKRLTRGGKVRVTE